MSYIVSKITFNEYTKKATTFKLRSAATGTITYNRSWWFVNGRTSYGDTVQRVYNIWINYDRFLLDNTKEVEL